MIKSLDDSSGLAQLSPEHSYGSLLTIPAQRDEREQGWENSGVRTKTGNSLAKYCCVKTTPDLKNLLFNSYFGYIWNTYPSSLPGSDSDFPPHPLSPLQWWSVPSGRQWAAWGKVVTDAAVSFCSSHLFMLFLFMLQSGFSAVSVPLVVCLSCHGAPSSPLTVVFSLLFMIIFVPPFPAPAFVPAFPFIPPFPTPSFHPLIPPHPYFLVLGMFLQKCHQFGWRALLCPAVGLLQSHLCQQNWLCPAQGRSWPPSTEVPHLLIKPCHLHPVQAGILIQYQGKGNDGIFFLLNAYSQLTVL